MSKRLSFVFLLLSTSGSAQTLFFQPPFISASLSAPAAMVTGDFNRDGKMDLAFASPSANAVSVLLGNGDGTFKATVTFPLPPSCPANFLASGDFNNDGKIDLLTTCGISTTLVVLTGNGDGTFRAGVTTTLPLPAFMGFVEGFVSAGIGDFDGDGNTDIVLPLLVNPNNVDLSAPGAVVLYLLRGKGDGTFPNQAQIAQEVVNPLSAATADFNNDGKLDFAVLSLVAGEATTVSLNIEIGDGQGAFHNQASYSTASVVGLTLLAADVNGDGKQDLVLNGANTPPNSISTASLAVFLGNGDGTFKTPFTGIATAVPDSFSLSAVVADIQGTGKPEIVQSLIIEDTNGLSHSAVIVWPNNGDGTFHSPLTWSLPQSDVEISVATADFNGDGRPDLAFNSFTVAALKNINVSSLSGDAEQLNQTFAEFPSGNAFVYLNGIVPETFASANAASYALPPVAASSIVAGFGGGLASTTQAATTNPLPTTLAGVSLSVKDSAGTARLAPLFYASPTQINYAIPDGTVNGQATVTITGNTQNGVPVNTVESILIAGVAPGLFDAGGVALGDVYTYANGSASPQITSTFQTSGGLLSPAPITIGPSPEQVYLILFGTGIRNHASSITATLGSVVVNSVPAAAQGVYVGEDQVNILLPQSLKGAGIIPVTLTVDGTTTNAVNIQIQ